MILHIFFVLGYIIYTGSIEKNTFRKYDYNSPKVVKIYFKTYKSPLEIMFIRLVNIIKRFRNISLISEL